MKRIMILITATMLMFSGVAFAGGDQNCGSKAQGTAGSTGQGTVNQNRAPGN